jgi:oligopeptide/dipeptide ABC transporter ATP-binding protein
MNGPVLQIRDLVVEYGRRGATGSNGNLRVFDGLDLDIVEGETLGIVGESGSGKSTLIGVLAGLIKPAAGSVTYAGNDLLAMKSSERRRASRDIQLVFQSPYSSLNPRMRVADIVAEPLLAHERLSASARDARIEALLRDVGVSPELRRARPPQLSGGQAQRVAIARALALSPRILLLDEPTSSLDLSVQAQILNLLARLTQERQLTCLLVSHDLAVVQHISDRVAVMYLGQVVEEGAGESVFNQPKHPYTRALIASNPSIDPDQAVAPALAGEIPSFMRPPAGCRFHTRCPVVMDRCLTIEPVRYKVAREQLALCHLFDPDLPAGMSLLAQQHRPS